MYLWHNTYDSFVYDHAFSFYNISQIDDAITKRFHNQLTLILTTVIGEDF